jgi:hypothetical protein
VDGSAVRKHHAVKLLAKFEPNKTPQAQPKMIRPYRRLRQDNAGLFMLDNGFLMPEKQVNRTA